MQHASLSPSTRSLLALASRSGSDLAGHFPSEDGSCKSMLVFNAKSMESTVSIDQLRKRKSRCLMGAPKVPDDVEFNVWLFTTSGRPCKPSSPPCPRSFIDGELYRLYSIDVAALATQLLDPPSRFEACHSSSYRVCSLSNGQRYNGCTATSTVLLL